MSTPAYRRVPLGVARGAVLPSRRGLRVGLGLYELEVAPYLRALVHDHSVCFDIGASGGYYAVALARRAAQGRVVCFEPDMAAFVELGEIVRSNKAVGGRVQLVNTQLGVREGPGTITVDAFVDAEGPGSEPDFLKIDVDGPEYDVLQGGAETIRRHHPRFIIETHGFQIEADCLRFLAGEDYGYRVVNPRRIWAEHRTIEVNRWVVAVHRSDAAFPLVCR